MATDLELRLDAEWRALQAAAADTSGPQRIIEAAAADRASRRAVLVELEDVRWSCRDLEQQLDEAGLGNTMATGRWTAVQVAAHLASWAKRTREELEALTGSGGELETIHFEPLAAGGPRTWNQREVDARQGWTAATVFREIDSELTRVADIVLRLPEHQLHGVAELPRTSGEPAQPWRYSLAAMLLMTCRHTRYHLRRLAGLRTAGASDRHCRPARGFGRAGDALATSSYACRRCRAPDPVCAVKRAGKPFNEPPLKPGSQGDPTGLTASCRAVVAFGRLRLPGAFTVQTRYASPRRVA